MTKKRDVKFIVFGVISLFLIAGCAGGGPSTGGAPTTPFLGGTNGLEIDFLTGSPPEEVTDGGTFPFQAVVSLKNMGEHELTKEQVRIDLIGILPEDFGVSRAELENKNPEDDVVVARRRDPEGNVIEPIETFVTFPTADTFFNFNEQIAGNTVFVFRADTCYQYQTRAVAQICVLEDLINIDENSFCNPVGSKRVFSSGSPVQVSSFRQNLGGQDKIQFSFDIVHSGQGNVFETNGGGAITADDCPKNPKERRQKENKVMVDISTGLATTLTCIGMAGSSGVITLGRDRRTVTCTQELDPNRNDFETNVDITLDFDYRDFADQEVLVKHLFD